jgi:glycosyltransferase involved in cell wall biosynthesis
MVSKACVVGAYQTKLEALARQSDLELSVIVPPAWKGPEGATPLERRHLAGYQLIVSPIRFNGNFHIHYYPELGRWMRRLRPDVVHMDEEPYNLATTLGLRAARRAGARSLFFTWQNLYRVYPLPFRLLERASFRLAGYAIAGNRAAGAVLRRKGYAGPIACIPQFGVQPDLYAPHLGREAGAPLRVGYAGRLVPEKGVDVLLKALADLERPWRAAIVGAGPEDGRLRQMADELGLAERVAFLGPRPSSAMPAFFAEQDVLVLPSLSRPNWIEQFGRVLIEAMAAGAVVVGSDCGEIPNVIGPAGLIFPEGDSAALADGLRSLAEDGALWERLAQAGRQRVLAHFTQAHIAEQTVSVYQSLGSTPFSRHHSVV